MHLIISVLSIRQNFVRHFKVIIGLDCNICPHYWSQKETNMQHFSSKNFIFYNSVMAPNEYTVLYREQNKR
jgi:dTDP-glucose pyrophosphorylase